MKIENGKVGRAMRVGALAAAMLVHGGEQGAAQTDSLPPLVPGPTYLSTVKDPGTFLGFEPGSKPARYDEVVRYLTYVAETSPRVKLAEMGKTYEGRMQYYVVVTDEGNHGRLDALRETNARLADGRSLGRDETSRAVESAPAVVWIGYGIHGDEISSVDASLHVLYHLAAGDDESTRKLLRDLIICIDPMQNPDGRERFLSQMEQWRGPVANPDLQSMHHSGSWPYGRGNHYLFDLNRDWFFLTQVESRNRVPAVVSWHPHVVIDSHEMGAYDTYLFSPPREPVNPNVSANTKKWWKIFASDQAKAFDRYGWSYYTREWLDEWYPGYGSSWSLYIDAIGILYEQAGVDGSLVKRPDGTTLTYRESVHHHIVSSLANLTTAASHRKDILADYAADRRAGVEPARGDVRVVYIPPSPGGSRVARMAEALRTQGIDVRVAEETFRASAVRDYWGSKAATREFPAGTLVVPTDQPQGRLARALLESDPRMPNAVLQEERKSLEKDGNSRQYDVSAWSLPHTFGVEAYWSADPGKLPAARYAPPGAVAGPAAVPDAAYGYLIEFGDDRSVEALFRILDRGVRVRSSRKPFTVEGKAYARGTLLVRESENAGGVRAILSDVAATTGVAVRAVNTALSTDGPDLGGNDMVLLRQPRIALLAGPESGTTGFGALWHLLDERIRVRVSVLPVAAAGSADLDKYNVLVVPDGSAGAYGRVLGKPGIARLRRWVESGGTLVGIGGGAEFCADTATGLSAVRLRHQALKELDHYAAAASEEMAAGTQAIDSVAIWEASRASRDTAAAKARPPQDEKAIEKEDERGRLFMPRGSILRVNLDPEHWICFGAGERLPAHVFTAAAFLSKQPVSTPARFAEAEALRLSGLLWPEARARWEKTAYATREGKGEGQVILFADDPAFRGVFAGTTRLLLNALVLGPGWGTARKSDW